MTDDTNKPPAGVPLSKSGPAGGAPTARPRTVSLAIGALLVAALFSIITAVAVSTQRDWLTKEQGKANAKALTSAVSSATASAAKKSADVSSASASASSSFVKKNPLGGTKLHDQISTQIQGTFISAILVLLVVGFLAYGTYRGRHWTRWGVTGFFILATFTGTGVGLLNFVNALVAGGAPAGIRIPTLIESLAMIVAVVLVNLRPSTEFFALSRPTPPAGAPQRRGLFGGPRPARPNQPQRAATTRPARATPAADAEKAKDADRQRAKKRAATESAARGAELARSRAKASKSRRTER